MANLEMGSQSQESFDTTWARALNEQEMQTMFDDKFFKDLESNDPLVKIEKIERDWKVYFSKPDEDKTKLREVWQGGTFVDIFYISKENWDNIVNRRTSISWAVQTAQAETQQLSQEVAATTTPQESPETLWASIEARTDALLDWFEDFSKKRPISKRPWESHDTKERLKEVIRNDIAYLKSVKRELKRYTYTCNPEIFQENLDALESHKQPLIEARQIIAGWGNTSELPTILTSLRDIKRADKFENKMAKYNKKVNELLKDATLKRLWNEDMEWFQDYLEDVWSGAIEHPAQHPFYTQHMRDFQHIQSINPTLYSQITTCQNPNRGGRTGWGETVVVCPWQWTSQCEWQKWVFDKWWEMFSDMLVKAGLIDENDTTKKEARWKFGKAALIWLWALAVYKIITTKWPTRWWWIWWSAAVLIWMANKESLYKWYNDAFWSSNPSAEDVAAQMDAQAGANRPTTPETQEIIDNLISPTTTTVWAIWWIKINTLISENIVSNDNNWKFQFDYNKYNDYVNNNVTDPDEKVLNLQASEKLKDNPSWLDSWLKSMWIVNMDILQEIWKDDKRLMDTDLIEDYFDNLNSPLNAELRKQWFKPKNTEARYKIMYLNNWKKNISDSDLIKYISDWLIVLRDESLAEYLDNDIVDLTKKCMRWCENIKFSTYEELLKSVKLTAWIIENFKWRTTARSDNPFHLWVGWFVWNIQFNDGVFIDTDVVKSSIFSNTLEKVSPTLNNNKHTYVAYLNKLWKAAS